MSDQNRYIQNLSNDNFIIDPIKRKRDKETKNKTISISLDDDEVYDKINLNIGNNHNAYNMEKIVFK